MVWDSLITCVKHLIFRQWLSTVQYLTSYYTPGNVLVNTGILSSTSVNRLKMFNVIIVNCNCLFFSDFIHYFPCYTPSVCN